MRVTIKDLSILLDRIKKVIPAKEGFHYEIDHAPIYGGYCLVMVKDENGAHYGYFGGNGTESRLTAKEFHAKLTGILEGAKAIQG